MKLPLATKVTSKLIDSEFIKVQPMAYPIGKLFYMDYIITTDKDGNIKLDPKNKFNKKDFKKFYDEEDTR